jgi:hypothetical protein
MNPQSQKLPLTKAGFLHPSHAQQAQFTLAHQGDNNSKTAASDDKDDDEEMEM